MACPWLLLKEVNIITGTMSQFEKLETVYELNPDDLSIPHWEFGPMDEPGFFLFPSDLSHSSNPHTYSTDPHIPANLPFFRTIAIKNHPTTFIAEKLGILYSKLKRFGVEYVVYFDKTNPIFIVCNNPKDTGTVLGILVTRGWSPGHGFDARIYVPTNSSPGRYEKIKAWCDVSLWVSIEDQDLRLRVRTIDDPLKGFQDLCWKFQEDCHHRSGGHDKDKEGHVTLWVESGGKRKDFLMPPTKGKKTEYPKSRRTDGVIEIIQSGIENCLFGKVVVGLQLVFLNRRDSWNFKGLLGYPDHKWIGEGMVNSDDSGKSQYHVAFPTSAVRFPQTLVTQPPSWNLISTLDNQSEPGSSLTYFHTSDTAGPDHIAPKGSENEIPGGKCTQKSHKYPYQCSCIEGIGSKLLIPIDYFRQDTGVVRDSVVECIVLATKTVDSPTAGQNSDLQYGYEI